MMNQQRSIINEMIGQYTTVGGINNAIQGIMGSETNIFDYDMKHWNNFTWEYDGTKGVSVLFAIMPRSVFEFSLDAIEEKKMECYIISWEES